MNTFCRSAYTGPAAATATERAVSNLTGISNLKNLNNCRIFNSAQIRSSYNSDLNSVRDFGLNFSCNETHFSITFTVRKSLHGRSDPESWPAQAQHKLKELQQLNEALCNTEVKLNNALKTNKKELTAALNDQDKTKKVK